MSIPIKVHPFFWVFAAILGWLFTQTFFGMLIWVGIISVSVIFHEFGHALTAVFFKQKARIELVAMGGVTIYDGPKLKFWQQFLITLNGPVFGFILFGIATLLLQFSWPDTIWKILKATQMANLFWTIVNLLPVLPLDGGQLLRIVLEGFFGVKGFKASLLIGSIIAVLLALYFFLVQNFLVGAFFFLFAFQSFDSWRKSSLANKSDREEGNKQLIVQAETALQEGRKEEAKKLLEEVREKAKGGLLFHAATEYLAFIAINEKNRDLAYDLLLPIKKHLNEESLCLLHELAAERKNYPVVAELATQVYQTAPSQKMALNNARAFADQEKPKEAGGWLQTAWQHGALHLDHILEEKPFQKVKDNRAFQKFIDPLK